jgi:hypothetical protein
VLKNGSGLKFFHRQALETLGKQSINYFTSKKLVIEKTRERVIQLFLDN